MSKEVLEGFPSIEEERIVLVRDQRTGKVGKYKCGCKFLSSENVCSKNQHGCIELRGIASIDCKRKQLDWVNIV